MRKMSLMGDNVITINNKSDWDRVIEDSTADLKELLEELTEPSELSSNNSFDYDDVYEALLNSSNSCDMDEPGMIGISEFEDRSIPLYVHPLQMWNDWNKELERHIQSLNPQNWIDDNLFAPATALQSSNDELKRHIQSLNPQNFIDNNLFAPITVLSLGKEKESKKDGFNQYVYTANKPDKTRKPRGTIGQSIHDYYYGQGYKCEYDKGDYASFYKSNDDGTKSYEYAFSGDMAKEVAQVRYNVNSHKNIEQHKKDFILEIYPIARIIQEENGLPAELIVAQASIESAYGSATPLDIFTGVNSNNFFGVKAYGDVPYVTCRTREVVDGKEVYMNEEFMAYANKMDSLKDYSKLIVKNYKPYVENDTITSWAETIQKRGYATDPNYARTILNVIEYWGLDAKIKKGR